MILLTSGRIQIGMFWGLGIGLTVLSQIYLVPKVLDVSNGQDFQLIWLAGKVWLSGENPYSETFDIRYSESFEFQRASHFWVYPPYWFPPATASGRLAFEDALLVWNLAGYLALWGGVAALVFALKLEDRRNMAPCVLVLAALASLLQATPFALSIGQTSMFIFFGSALFIAGGLQQRRLPVFLGLLIAMMKPQVGVLFLTFALLEQHMRLPAVVVLAVLALFSLPALLAGGTVDTVYGFVGNLSAYNSSGAVANLPEHLVGLQKLLSLVGVSISSTPLVLLSAVGIVAARVAGVGREQLLCLTVLFALLATGLHTYDLTLALCLFPFVSQIRGWRLALLVAGFALIARPANLAAVNAIGYLDSGIFPGSLHATFGLLLLLVALCHGAVDRCFRARE